MKLKFLFMLMLLLPMSSMAQKVAYAVLKDSTLTFYYGKNKPEGAYDVEKMVKVQFEYGDGYFVKEWDSVSPQIKTAVFDKSFKKYRPKSCSRWFDGCKNLSSIIGIKENLNTSEVTDMNRLFAWCESLTNIDVSGFNTENVTNMSIMFEACTELTNLDVSSFQTDKVTNMERMFNSCHTLTSLDVSGFNTDKVTNMGGMFAGCSNLSSLDVSGFNTENVTNLDCMFYGCTNLTSLDVSGFNTEKVTDMMEMFQGCKNLTTIYVGNGWNIINVTDSEDMFRNCPNLIGGQGTKYDPYHTDVEYAHIDGGESNPGYFTKKTE